MTVVLKEKREVEVWAAAPPTLPPLPPSCGLSFRLKGGISNKTIFGYQHFSLRIFYLFIIFLSDETHQNNHPVYEKEFSWLVSFSRFYSPADLCKDFPFAEKGPSQRLVFGSAAFSFTLFRYPVRLLQYRIDLCTGKRRAFATVISLP